MATDITYNGTVIGSLEGGKTATLACAGKKAVSNIVVAFDNAGSITYNGSATEVESGKTATLQCAGKKMTDDVYVTVNYETVDVTELVGTWTLAKKNLDQSMLIDGAKHNMTFTYGSKTTQYVAFEPSATSDYISVYAQGSTTGSNLYYDGSWSRYSTNAHIWHVTEVTETDFAKLLAIKQFLETNGTKS